MSESNGHANPGGAPYAFIGDACSLVTHEGVLTLLERNAQLHGKTNLLKGPQFRKIADDFRNWSRECEPGWIFRAPEVKLTIIRLASSAPQVLSVSEEMAKKIAEQVQQQHDDLGGRIAQP